MKIHSLISTGIFVIGLAACHKNNEKQAAPPPVIKVVKVAKQSVPIYSEFVGQVYGLYDIPIRARVEGFLVGIFFKEGQRVTKGQLLYTIDAQPFIAKVASEKSKVAEAQTLLANAEKELNRYKPLAAKKAVSQSDLDAAQANYEAALASLEAAKANLQISQINLSYTKMKSPINGLIGKTEAKIGEFVGKDPNPVILNTVSRIDTIRVQFFLNESEYLRIAKEYNAELKTNKGNTKPSGKVEVQLILSDGELYAHQGRIDFVGRNVDASTGSILVQASFPNTERLLRPGMYAKVKIPMEVINDGLLIPQRSVNELQGQYSVFVVTKENITEARQIKIKDKVGDYYVLEEGLNESDQIVYEGLQKVNSGLLIKPEIVDFQSKFAKQE